MANLVQQKARYISKVFIPLLQLHQHRRLYIRKPNVDGLHWNASRCSNSSSFSAIAARQNADTLRCWLLFSTSSAWWSWWMCHEDSRGRRNRMEKNLSLLRTIDHKSKTQKIHNLIGLWSHEDKSPLRVLTQKRDSDNAHLVLALQAGTDIPTKLSQ